LIYTIEKSDQFLKPLKIWCFRLFTNFFEIFRSRLWNLIPSLISSKNLNHMETKALVLQNWDDLVFEKRNKSYGAYVLRKSYSNNVIVGWGITMALFAGLMMFSKYSHFLFGDKGSQPKEKTLVGLIQITDIPIPRLKPPVQPPPQARPRARANTVPIVTTAQVDYTPIDEPVDNVNIPGDENVEYVMPVEPVVPVEVIPPPPPIVDFAEIMPTYTGGAEEMMKFLQRNLRYPASARRMGIEGTVFVKFIVNGDGSLSDVHVIRGIHPDCDKEAARVIAMLPGWIGGKQGGRPVGVRMVLPIKFKLEH
jgi:periplasmic protein TonB